LKAAEVDKGPEGEEFTKKKKDDGEGMCGPPKRIPGGTPSQPKGRRKRKKDVKTETYWRSRKGRRREMKKKKVGTVKGQLSMTTEKQQQGAISAIDMTTDGHDKVATGSKTGGEKGGENDLLCCTVTQPTHRQGG